MKKIGAILLSAVMLCSLVACGGDSSSSDQLLDDVLSGGNSSSSAGTGFSKDDVDESPAPESSREDNTSSGSNNNSGLTLSYTDEDGSSYYDGYLGDTAQTAWFQYTVTDAYLVDPATYPEYTVSDGYTILAVELTIKNTSLQSLPMYLYDFQIQWGDSDDEDAYSWPISTGDELLDPDQFPDEYDVGINATRSGKLLFEVPEAEKDFCLAFAEYYEDDSIGDLFFIYFTAE